MFHRIATRALFWSALTVVSLACALASAGSDVAMLFAPIASLAAASGLLPLAETLTRVALTAPVVSAISLAVAAAGWRLLNREIAVRDRESHALAKRAVRLHDAMQASADSVFLLRTVRDAMGTITDFEIADANPMGARLLRTTPDSLTGLRLRADARGYLDASHFEELATAVAFGEPLVREVRVDRRRFDASWVMEQAVPIPDGLALTIRDISARKREERALRRASITDHLTGLLNRRGFLTLADQQARLARRQEKDFVLIYADLDGFKGLNDRFGHAEGDRALEAVGRVLRRAVRDCDLVARMGGDEFTIMAADADHNAARLIQRRIEQRIEQLNASRELVTDIALTIGHTRVRHTDSAPLPELLARADALLYSRKRRRKAAAIAAQHARGVTPKARPQAASTGTQRRHTLPGAPVLEAPVLGMFTLA